MCYVCFFNKTLTDTPCEQCSCWRSLWHEEALLVHEDNHQEKDTPGLAEGLPYWGLQRSFSAIETFTNNKMLVFPNPAFGMLCPSYSWLRDDQCRAESVSCRSPGVATLECRGLANGMNAEVIAAISQ